MKLGSHNTMSYLPCKWYMKPFNFIAKCQSKTIEEQLKAGVEIFDLRIRFDRNSNPYFCHGLIQYHGAFFWETINTINNYDLTKRCYIRLILETSRADAEQEYQFKLLCSNLAIFRNVLYFEGVRKYDWKVLYDFGNSYTLTQLVGSMQGMSFFPYLYARLNNQKNMAKYEPTDEFCMFDFV